MTKRNKSIIQNDMSRCYICGTTQNLHIHEIFYGTANRKKSIEYGCYVTLCGYHHNLSNNSVHMNNDMNKWLKRETQLKFEELYGHEQFMMIFRKSYL